MTDDNKVIAISVKSGIMEFAENFKTTNELKKFHLIIDLSTIKNLTTGDLKPFVKIAKTHNSLNNKSFVIVSDDITYNDIPETLSLTPTLQEACDIIQMENIERDLGF